MKINIKLVLVFLIISFGIVFAQDLESQLNLQYNSKLEYKREVYNQILGMIREAPEAEEVDKLYFNLAELSIEIDREDPEKTASYYKQVLQYNRDFIYKDLVLYNIGYFSEKAVKSRIGLEQQGQGLVSVFPDSLSINAKTLSEPIYYYRRLLEEHPLSSYYAETAWRLGRLYYTIALISQKQTDFEIAETYYDKASQNKDTEYYYFGISGKAWCKLGEGDNESALEATIHLLNQLDSIPAFDNSELLIQEAVENCAWLYTTDSNFDFSNMNITYARLELRLKAINNEQQRRQILMATAGKLLEADLPQQSLDLYNKILEAYPLFAQAPLIAAAQQDIFKKYPDRFGGVAESELKIILLEKEVIRKFNPLSEWYQANKGENPQAGVEFVRSIMEKEEIRRYNAFISNPERRFYSQYRNLVTDYSGYKENSPLSDSYLQTYRKNLVFMSQKVAQNSGLAEDYRFALQDLEEFNDFYPEHSERITFQKNIFFCYEKLFDLASTQTLEGWENADSLYMAASRDYENILRNDENFEYKQEELARVIFKRAEILFESGELGLAENDYNAITQLLAEDEIISDAWRRLAELALIKSEYLVAERYLRNAMDFTEGYAQSEVYKNIIAVIEEYAASLLEEKRYAQSAKELLRLSLELEAVYPQKSIQEIIKAIDIYENLGDDEKVNELLEVLSKRENEDQIVSVYEDTWQEADKLEDYQRSIMLRQEFIDSYPGLNAAFKAKLQIIEIYEKKLGEGEKAAEMYLDLYNNIMNNEIQPEQPENIYLNALRIYQDLDNREKCIELTERFVEIYPDYSLVDLNLTYSDHDNTRTSIRKLQKLKEQIELAYRAEDYPGLKAGIEQFRQISAALNADSVQVSLGEDNLIFDQYQAEADYFLGLKTILDKAETEFLLTPATELIPVLESSRWQEDMVGGKNLIGKLNQKCENYRNQIMEALQKGNDYRLESSDYTHSIWVIAAVYDHAYKVLDQQIKNFVVKSNQVNRPELKNNKYLQSELKRRVIAEGREYSFEFQLKAAEFYQNLLFQFSDNQDYTDLWTRKAQSRLSEWGIRDAQGAMVALDEEMLIAEESYANEEIVKEYNDIYAQYQSREYAAAQVKFMNFIKSYPGHNLTYEALYFAGECYYNMGQLSKAEELFEKILDFEKDKTPDALLRLGHCYNSTGKKKDAFEVWNRLMEEYPDHYLADVIRLTFEQMRLDEEKRIAAASVSSRKVEKITLKYRKYMQFYQKGEYSRARDGFESIWNKYPEHPLSYSSEFMYAESAYMDKRYSDAARVYGKLAEMDGNKKVNSMYKMGLCAEKTGQISLRDQYWQRIVNQYPDHYFAGLISGNQVVRPVRSSPGQENKPAKQPVIRDSAQYIYKKALMAFRYNEYDEAIGGFQSFYKANPDHRLAFNARLMAAEAMQKIGKYEQSIKLYEELLPESGAGRSKILLHLGESYAALEQNMKAREFLNTVKVDFAGTFEAAQAKQILINLPGEADHE